MKTLGGVGGLTAADYVVNFFAQLGLEAVEVRLGGTQVLRLEDVLFGLSHAYCGRG